MSVNNDQFGVMVNCGIVEQLRIKHKNVQIKCDIKQQKIILTGPESALSAFQIDALTRLNTIEKKRLNGLEESVVRYLSESMSGSEVITKLIQNQLREKNIIAMIGLDGEEPCLRVGTINDFKQGINLIKEYIVIETIRTDEPRANVVKSPAWKEFHQDLRRDNACGIYIKPNEEILMVGIRSKVKMLKVEINKFLDNNAIKRYFLQLPYGSARFVIERSPLFTPEACERREIKCGLTPEGGGGVFATGKMRALDDVHTDFRKLRNTIIEMTHTLDEPGIKEYYQGEEGRKFLEQTGRVNNCIILTMSKECAEWIEYNKKNLFLEPIVPISSSVDFKEQELISVTLAKTSVKLKVWKTNIIKHKCDVIVNASNPELALLPGGVSGKHWFTDNFMELSSQFHCKAQVSWPFIRALIFSLSTIKRWNSISSRSDPKLLLKACVLRSLKCVGTAGLKSVAIPAISCGVFGGNISVCIPLILDAVVDYFNETPNSSVKQVDFVELDNQAVLDAFVKAVKKYRPKEMLLQPSRFLSQPSRSQQINQASGSTVQTSCCRISVIVGDISTQHADVIVNVTDTQNVNNIAKAGAVSKLLGQKAGANIIQQCANLLRPFNVGDVLETDGGSLPCRKLYHALVTNYNQRNSQGIIQSVVSKSLQKAEMSRFKSIAFSAIATGGYSHPPNLIAQWMRQEISQFQGNNLKQVFIVLYSGNRAVISAFNAEFKTGLNSSGNPSFTPTASEESKNDDIIIKKIDDETTRYGSLKVSVIKGDITEQDTDVIVNSTDQKFDLSQGMVSTQILNVGGNSIQNEAWDQTGGDYVVTSGGNLPCKKIIHLVMPSNQKDLQKKIIRALIEVGKLGLSSVSLPAFGTGNLHMDCSTIGSIMRDSIESFVKSYPNSRHPSSVKVVIFDKKMLKDFKDTILIETAKKGFLSKLRDFGKSFFSSGSGTADEDIQYKDNSFPLYLYSTNKEYIEEAIDSINNDIQKITQKQAIVDDVIGRLGKWEWFEILEIGRSEKIEITDDSDMYTKRLILDGLTKNVVNAHEAIKDILREFAAAETFAAFVFWQRKDQAGAWKDFPMRAVHKLEIAFKKRNGDSTNPTLNKVQVSEFDGVKVIQTTIDLSKLDNDPQGRNPPDIRRRVKEKSVSDIPTFWDDMSGKQSLEVVLTPGSQEYQNVLAKFISAGQFHQTIVSIERIQNLSLYKQYVAKKAEVTEKHGANLGKPIEEQLFNGTIYDDQIISNGFDRSHAGKNATMYGRGVYFATTANYSHGYAAPNQSGNRRMFLVDVITGDYCQGNQNIVALPQRRSNLKNDLYDSVVDNVMNPTIFVVFKDASAYPTYRITYV
ncbi:protein mono-ADP-ribosyltransferase PARP14-like [Styela clava]